MNENTVAELERDAETARAKVADTAESIRNKMTPGQLIDELSGLFSGNDSTTALSNLKAQVRDNPLPIALVGAGLAWLMFGQGASHSANGHHSSSSAGRQDAPLAADGLQSYGSDWAAGVEATGAFSKTAAAAKDMAGDLATSVKDSLGGAARSIGDMTDDVTSSAKIAADSAVASVQSVLEREPLAVAALGLAIGTAIGILLPRTSVEDEQLGHLSATVRDKAEDFWSKGVEEAKDVAAEAYQAVKDEANRQGLVSDNASLTDQVGQIVKSAAGKVESTVRERVTRASKDL